MSKAATFAKLRDGSWGLRVAGAVSPGEVVTAVTKDGRREEKRIGLVLCQATSTQPALCSIADSTARSASSATRRSGSRGRRTGCSCGSREDESGNLIPSDRNCSSCEHDA